MLQLVIYHLPGLSGGMDVSGHSVCINQHMVTARQTSASTRYRATFLCRYCGLRSALLRRQLH
jgi:hypothetical protein